MLGFPDCPDGKESACNAGELGSVSRLGRPPGEGKDYPLQYSGLENSMDCIVHGVTKSQARLSDFHSHTDVCARMLVCVCVLGERRKETSLTLTRPVSFKSITLHGDYTGWNHSPPSQTQTLPLSGSTQVWPVNHLYNHHLGCSFKSTALP